MIHLLSVHKWCIQGPMYLLSHLFSYGISSQGTCKRVFQRRTLLCFFCSQKLDVLRLMETRVSYLFILSKVLRSCISVWMKHTASSKSMILSSPSLVKAIFEGFHINRYTLMSLCATLTDFKYFRPSISSKIT